MSRANLDIWREAKSANVAHWQIAKRLGCAESTFCRKLRDELSLEDKEIIRQAIKEIAETAPVSEAKKAWDKRNTKPEEPRATSEPETPFAGVLKILRMNEGLKQSDVAEAIGMSKQVISNYENGAREPSLKTLIDIADFFKTTTDQLLGRERPSSNRDGKKDEELETFREGKGAAYSQGPCKLICIYDHPADYPDKFVARLWIINVPTQFIVLADDIESLRGKMPKKFKAIPRHALDDAPIVETWV
jgi:transcriptional regulator with XRE-family HTH domain